MYGDLKKALAIIGEARQKGIVFFMENEKIKYKLPGERPADLELIRNISAYRNEIKELLQSALPAGEGGVEMVAVGMPHRTPLSFSQERIWFIHQLEGSDHYHVCKSFRIKGKLNPAALASALEDIVDRHATLRMVIREDKEGCYQHILPPGHWAMQVIDRRDYSDIRQQQETHALFARSFDLSVDHPLRVYLIVLNTNEHLLLFHFHHIATDAWSWGIFMRELKTNYEARACGKRAALPDLPIPYGAYTVRQRRRLQGEFLARELDYWKEQLRGYRTFELLFDTAIAERRGEGRVRHLLLDGTLAYELRLLSQRCGATLFMTLAAVFNILLYGYSRQPDIGIGTPVAGRMQADTEGLIGLFVNMVVLRSRLQDSVLFREFINQMRATTLDAYQHQELPFEKVVEALATGRTGKKQPLFQVAFLMDQEQAGPAGRLGDLELEELQWGKAGVKVDLMLIVVITDAGLSCQMEYDGGLYSDDRIAGMLDDYSSLLRRIVADADQSIGDLVREINDGNGGYAVPLPMFSPYIEAELRPRGEYRGPQTPLQSLLAAVWSETLVLEKVDIRDNFFLIGGTSLTVYSIVSRVRDAGYNLEVGDMFDHQTIEALADHLESLAPSAKNVVRGRTSQGYVRLLNEGGDGKPIFILPGSPGFCDAYDVIARGLGGICPVYGIELPGLRKGEKPLPDLAGTAQFAIECLREVQPDGPYRLIGHSMGAYVGFEMICQWEQAGEKQGFFVILDSYADKYSVLDLPPGETIDTVLLGQAHHFLNTYGVIGDHPPEWFSQLRKELPFVPTNDKAGCILAFAERNVPPNEKTALTLRALWTTLVHALMPFAPGKKVRTPILVIKAVDGDWKDKEEDLGWPKHATTVDAVQVAGTHIDMLKGSNGRAVARSIKHAFFS